MGQGSPSTWRYTADGIRAENGDLVCDAPDPLECTHLGCNVAKPVRTVQTDAAHVLGVVTTLAGRWQRNADAEQEKGELDLHASGRREGYVQAIALLLGLPHRTVLDALASGALR